MISKGRLVQNNVQSSLLKQNFLINVLLSSALSETKDKHAVQFLKLIFIFQTLNNIVCTRFTILMINIKSLLNTCYINIDFNTTIFNCSSLNGALKILIFPYILEFNFWRDSKLWRGKKSVTRFFEIIRCTV